MPLCARTHTPTPAHLCSYGGQLKNIPEGFRRQKGKGSLCSLLQTFFQKERLTLPKTLLVEISKINLFFPLKIKMYDPWSTSHLKGREFRKKKSAQPHVLRRQLDPCCGLESSSNRQTEGSNFSQNSGQDNLLASW